MVLALLAASAAIVGLISHATLGKDSPPARSNSTAHKVNLPKYKNEDFYANGKFQVEKHGRNLTHGHF